MKWIAIFITKVRTNLYQTLNIKLKSINIFSGGFLIGKGYTLFLGRLGKRKI
jgi:hypothetical protein